MTIVALLSTGFLKAAPDGATNSSGSVVHKPLIPSQSTKATNSDQASGEKIDLPVPIGEPVKGIKIPQYDEKGKLTMNLIADTARKLDDRQVEFTKLKVQFNDQEEKEIVVEIPHSIIDMRTKVLVADTETTIHREDFDIVGQSADFDTVARKGTLKGHVTASFRNPASPQQNP